jgi:hypothetical protein
MASNGGITNDLEENSCDLIEAISGNLPEETEENDEKPQS